MVDVIIAVVLLMIVGAAIHYIVKAKKSGAKCIGCPAGGNCSHGSKSSGQGRCQCKGESTCGCHADTKQKI